MVKSLLRTKIGFNRYSYCLNNPLKYTDPSGMLIDWVQRTVDGITEIYYDRDVKSQADVDVKYGKKSGVTHLQDGYTFNGYTFYNDHVNNLYGVVKNSNGNVINNDRNIVYGNDFTIFAGVTNNSVNAETLHQNWFGTSYTGPKNPTNHNKDDNFDYNPRNISEYYSITHDNAYNDLEARGVREAFLNTNTWKVDLELGFGNIHAVRNCHAPLKDQARSAATAAAFIFIGTYKAPIQGVKKTYYNIFGH